MTILAVKSIPLMRGTNNAWKTVPGLFFADRKRDSRSIERHIASRHYDAVINLGRVDIDFGNCLGRVFNDPSTVRAISTPKALRRTLDDFIPKYTHIGNHWHKSRGYGGMGKSFHAETEVSCVGYDGDAQRHIPGLEYRIVTVGDRIVQASLKGERRTMLNGRNSFAYSWVGVEGVKNGGFIPLLKEAIRTVPGGQSSVLGWDVLSLVGETPCIIEVNTCPGVNSATAGRIISRVKGLL